ncbi:MFS transporter, partial [Paraburkholderia bengalensis]
ALAPAEAHAARAVSHDAPVSPLRDAGVWRVALGIGVLCVPQLAVVTFATVFLHDFGRVGVAGISATMAAVQTGAAIARVWSGRWTDRHGNRRQYMRACSVLTALLFASLALVAARAAGAAGAVSTSGVASLGATHGTLTILLAAMVVLGGVSASAWHGVAYTELATLAGTRRAGTALAMGNTCAFMTLFVTPLAIAPLLAATSWPAVWAIASVCALIALPIFPRPPRVAPYSSRARA